MEFYNGRGDVLSALSFNLSESGMLGKLLDIEYIKNCFNNLIFTISEFACYERFSNCVIINFIVNKVEMIVMKDFVIINTPEGSVEFAGSDQLYRYLKRS